MFKVGDLVITTDAEKPYGESSLIPEMWSRSEEALALVVRVPETRSLSKYPLQPGMIQVHYLTGPCSGDVVREFEELFALVSPANNNAEI